MSAADEARSFEPSSRPFLIMCIVSIPAITARAQRNVLKPHGSHDAFDRPVVSLDDAVEILRLTQLDVCAGVVSNALDGGGVGAAFVDGDLLRHAVQVHSAFEKLPRRRHVTVSAKREVNGVAGAVDGPVQILPLATDLDVRLAHPSTHARRTFASAKRRGQHRQTLDDQRCTVARSTKTPRSAIISSMCRRLSGWAAYQRTQVSITSNG